MRGGLTSVHPAVSFLFFAVVLFVSATALHPAALCAGLAGALLSAWVLLGGRETCQCLKWSLPMAVLAAVVNPAFNHRGVTTLFYLPSGNPLTLESLVYGLSAGGMLLTVLLWCACLRRTMTTDKILYLFGRVAPSLSLLLSMTLRLIPRYRLQARRIAQAWEGLAGAPKTRLASLRAGGHTLSILVTWALENGVETADVMRSRGYGLPGRSAFSLYRMERRDRRILFFMGAAVVPFAAFAAAGALSFRCYPSLAAATGGGTFAAALFYFMFCMLPVYLAGKEAWIWSHWKS